MGNHFRYGAPTGLNTHWARGRHRSPPRSPSAGSAPRRRQDRSTRLMQEGSCKRLCENMHGSRNGRIFFSEGPSHQKARARRRSFKRCEQKWTSHLLGEMQFTILSSQTGTAHFKPRLWSRAALPFRSDPTSKVPRRACRHPRLRQVPDH